jgi:hypothetical protein
MIVRLDQMESFKGTHHCIANSINQATKPIISPNTLCGGKKRGG